MAEMIADVVSYDQALPITLSLRFCFLWSFSDIDLGAKRRVAAFVCKCNVPARKEEIMDLPPSFDPVCLENRVNMSLLMPLPTFAAASDLVGFVTSKRFCFSQTDRVCILPYCEACVTGFVEP